jgi:DNA processing protein
MNSPYIHNLLALTMTPGVGNMTAQNLISYCGGIDEVFKAKKEKLMKTPGVGEVIAQCILRKECHQGAEDELVFIEKNNIQVYDYLSPIYPRRLKECRDLPLILFFKGNVTLDAPRTISIIGTRNASDYSQRVIDTLLEDLKGIAGLHIYSGLAHGVDIKAHKSALKNNIPTIGVMGTGLSSIYPAAHRKQAVEMVENGGLLTEFVSTASVVPGNFPMRNRIIAGMSDAVIVIESKIKGGAVITANIANTYNKDVFAVPGKITDSVSIGCNFLIKTYKATMLESAADLLYNMGWSTDSPKVKVLEFDFEGSANEKLVHRIIKDNPGIEIDKLSFLSEMNGGALAGVLLEMELNGIVRTLPGKKYEIM